MATGGPPLPSTRAAGDRPLVCDVAALVRPDLGAIDALARLALTAVRARRHLELVNASQPLLELLTLVGLQDAVGLEGRSGVEPGRQAEEREDVGDVEEERHSHHLAP